VKLWKELLRKAYEVATWSNDPSTQNGALIVSLPPDFSVDDTRYTILGGDFNRFPKGVKETPERWNDRALKYKLVQHAERNTTAHVRHLHGLVHLCGHTMICPWAACTECAKEIIGDGIVRLVIHKQAHDRTPQDSPWMEDIKVAHMMLREAGVEIVVVDGKIDGPQVRHSGQIWTP
jgi:dCMP deaminase